MVNHDKIHRYLIWLANQITTEEQLSMLLHDKLKTFQSSLASQISWEELTIDDVQSLGFLYYDYEQNDNTELWLVPTYLQPVIPEGTKLQTIDGVTFLYDPILTPTTTFYGAMAYGVVVKRGKDTIDA